MNTAADDFEYDSGASDPEGLSSILSPPSRQHGAAATRSELQGRSVTPTQDASRRPMADMPSIMMSTPAADRGRSGYDTDGNDLSGFSSGMQPQHAQRSDMYANNSTDFATRLKGDVVVSGVWSAVGSRPPADSLDDTMDLSGFPAASDDTDTSYVADQNQRSPFPVPVQEMEERHPHARTASTALPHTLQQTAREVVDDDDDDDDDLADIGRAVANPPRKVSFAPPPTGQRQRYDTEEETDDSIVFREQGTPLSQTRPPWDTPSGGTGGAEEDATQLAVQPRQRSISPMVHLPIAPNSLSLDGMAGGVGGVGMGASIFRKFANWGQSHLSPRSPKPMPMAMAMEQKSDSTDQDEDLAAPKSANSTNGARGNRIYSDGESTPQTQRRQPAEANADTPGSAHSGLSTSSASPLSTEPMRSRMLSSVNTTPASNHRNSARRDRSQTRTPPRRTPRSARRLSQTPLQSVNPLARHLAIRALQSTSPAQRRASFDMSMTSSRDLSPGTRGRRGAPRPLFFSPGNSFMAGDRSMTADTSILSMTDIQDQLDGFANMLKHDASAVQEDVRASEQMWLKMQQDIHDLQAQLLEAESRRDLYERKVEQAQRDRLEWEAERQMLSEDKADLLSNIEQWRKRIDDIETNRQGVWKEGTQSREQLLHAIARLEDELTAARHETRQTHARFAPIVAEMQQREVRWAAERENLELEIDEYADKCEQIESDNQNMQADMYQAQLRASNFQEKAHKLTREVEVYKTQAGNMHKQLAEYEGQTLELRKRMSELVADNAKIRESEEQARKHIEELGAQLKDTSVREREQNSVITQLTNDTERLKETIDDLNEMNKDLKQQLKEHQQQLQSPPNEDAATVDTADPESSSSPSDSDLTEPPAAKSDTSLEPSISQEKFDRASETIKELETKLQEAIESANSDRDDLTETIAILVDEKRQLKSELADIKTKLANIDSLKKKKDEYKQQNLELLEMAETAQTQIEMLNSQLMELQRKQQQLESEHSDQVAAETEELAHLRESESQLRSELETAERDRENLATRMQLLDERNRTLSRQNDELSHRAARLETELADLQLQAQTAATAALENPVNNDAEVIQELRNDLADLQKLADILQSDVDARMKENDQLRQSAARKDTELEDAQMQLQRAQKDLDSERAALKAAQEAIEEIRSPATPTATTSATTSPKLDQPETLTPRALELSRSLQNVKEGISALEDDIAKHTERHSKLESEKHELSIRLRDLLNGNAALRDEFSLLMMRRAGKIKEMSKALGSDFIKEFQQQPDLSAQSDDGNTSFMSSSIAKVPWTSQLLDDSNSKYLNVLDKHLADVEVAKDKSKDEPASALTGAPSAQGAAGNQRINAIKSSPLRRSNSLQATSSFGRPNRKVLTPIREEFSLYNKLFREFGIQCDISSEGSSGHSKQDSEQLSKAAEQVYHLEEEMRVLRSTVANVKQERDQFRVSQEEAAEQVKYLTGQIEDLSEKHERMKAINFTSARVSLRVHRQLAVLKQSLSRLQYGTSQTSSRGGTKDKGVESSILSPQEVEDKEDALAIQEDDEMIQATIDRPLDSNDYALLGLIAGGDGGPSENASATGATDRPFHIDDENLGTNNDEVLEQVGMAVSEAYGEVKRLRYQINRANRDRVRMLKRLSQAEAKALPSAGLTENWNRSMRHRSYTESLVHVQSNGNGNSNSNDAAMAAASAKSRGDGDRDSESNFSEPLLEDMEPPASLFLDDISTVMANRAAATHNTQSDKASAPGTRAESESKEDAMARKNREAMWDPIKAVTRMMQLSSQLKKKQRRLNQMEVECSKMEKAYNEIIHKNQRLNSEITRAKRESQAMKDRFDSRTANRTMTPVRATNWDDMDSIEREMRRCKKQNLAFMKDIERLCQVLNQHTIDQALAGDSAGAESSEDYSADSVDGNARALPRPAKAVNMYRTLLMDMADVLDARRDLVDGMSIRYNFGNLAAAVRRRLDEKDKEIHSLRSSLDLDRLSGEAAGKKIADQTSNSLITREQLTDAQDQASELKVQVDSLTTQIRDLRHQVSELEGQLQESKSDCNAFEDLAKRQSRECDNLRSEIENLKSENNGLYDKYQACNQALDHQTRECMRLEHELRGSIEDHAREIDQLARTTSTQGSIGTADLQRMREQWTLKAREETIDEWRHKERALCEMYESQIAVLRWAYKMWCDVVYSILPTVPSQPESRALQNDDELETKAERLRLEIERLDDGVQYALEQAETLHQSASRPFGSNDLRPTTSFDSIIDGLSGDFGMSWLDSVRGCVVAVVSGIVGASGLTSSRKHSGKKSANTSPMDADSGSPKCSEYHELTPEQKAKIRSHYGRILDEQKSKHAKEVLKLKDSHDREMLNLRDRHKQDHAALVLTNRALVSESKYHQGRLFIESSRVKSLLCQINIIVQIIGGYEGLSREIEKRARHRRALTLASNTREDKFNRPRQLWRRVLFAVRLKNNLQRMVIERQNTNADKIRGLEALNALKSRTSSSHAQQQGNLKQTRKTATSIPPQSTDYSNGRAGQADSNSHYQGNYHLQQQHQHLNGGMKTAPITPSRLRNRLSDLRSSSTGSSFGY
ncbi:hypothetical protein GGI07_002362 [Coemansia sp. Benny D115]|nr:hypothetical protein GGI07_002362 [Coemansia sp. Benny D115]